LKLEVLVEDCVEMILTQKMLLVFLQLGGGGGGGVLGTGAEIAACIFTRNTITTSLYRPLEEIFHFTINFLIAALNLNLTHFHIFDILHCKKSLSSYIS
jgi:hypothetical protein